MTKSAKPRKIIKRRIPRSSIVDAATKSIGKRESKPTVEFLSSGSTTLNLALSGKGQEGGWARARVVNIVGDGSSGKTLLALELIHWCLNNIKKVKPKSLPPVKSIQIVYRNAESVMDFPLEKMYGENFEKQIIWKENDSIEAVGRDYINRFNKLKKGEFLLYIIDSWDALKSVKDNERFAESISKNKEIEGSFNLEKQKYASKFFSYICSLQENNSKKDATLLIISQIRTKIGAFFGKKTYRAGGKALDFYTHQVVWIREAKKLDKSKLGEKRDYGIESEAKVERSKVSKPNRSARFTILFDYGLDDLSSTTKYIWGNKIIKFKGKEFQDSKKFIRYVEDNNLEKKVSKKAERKWNRVEDAFSREVSSRKRRF